MLILTKSNEVSLDNWQDITLYLVEKLIRKTSLGSNLSSLRLYVQFTYLIPTSECLRDILYISCESESPSVVPNSLWPHGLYNPRNSLGQDTGVGSLSLPGDLPNPGVEPRSPSLQADSLPAEPQGKPYM